jgi:hypothetical protein
VANLPKLFHLDFKNQDMPVGLKSKFNNFFKKGASYAKNGFVVCFGIDFCSFGRFCFLPRG